MNSAGFSFTDDELSRKWRPDVKDFVQSISPAEFSAGKGYPVITVQRLQTDPSDGVQKWMPEKLTLDQDFNADDLYKRGPVRVDDTEQNRLALGLLDGTATDALIRNMMFPQFGTAARAIQSLRFENMVSIHYNAQMSSKLIREFCTLDDISLQLLKTAMERLNLSARAYDRILKVARTIADLEMSSMIQSHHIAEAIQYRSLS